MTPVMPRRGRRWWIPVAVVAGGFAAVGGGVLLSIALTGGDGTTGRSSPSPAVTASAVASSETLSTSPSESASAEPTPSPTPVAQPIIPNLAIAAITVDALAVWSEPSEATIQYGELGEGARLFIIGDSMEDDGLRWYRIAYVDGPSVSGFELGPCQLNCSPTLGYVATPAAGADEWLEEVEIGCPAPPLTTDQLAGLVPLERLHCYGSSDITVSGALDDFTGGPSSGAFLPSWLAATGPRSAGGGALQIHFPPTYAGELPDPLSTISMVGHFEDDAAPTCEVDFTRISDGPSTPWVVLGCRSAFVVTEVEVLAAP